MCCWASNCLLIFCYCFCCWVLVLIHCDQIECRGLFIFSFICWGLLCTLRYDQFCRKFHGLLRRMYIVRMFDEIFCRHQLGPFDLWCDLVLQFHCWFFVWMMHLLVRGGIKVSYYHYIGVYMCFKSFKICLMKLGTLRLGAYKLIIVILFWCISPFLSTESASLSCLINISLKSTFLR
jgi:hypothetical protein